VQKESRQDHQRDRLHLALNHDFSQFQRNADDDRKAIQAIGEVLLCEPIVFDLGLVGEAGPAQIEMQIAESLVAGHAARDGEHIAGGEGLSFSDFFLRRGSLRILRTAAAARGLLRSRISWSQMDSSLSWMRSRPGQPKKSCDSRLTLYRAELDAGASVFA